MCRSELRALVSSRGRVLRADSAGVHPEVDTVRWVNELTGRLRQNLAKLGWCSGEQPKTATEAGRLLKPFLDQFAQDRTDFKAWSKRCYEITGNCWSTSLVVTRCCVTSLQRTPNGFAVTCGEEAAPATVSKHVKRSRTNAPRSGEGSIDHRQPFR